MERAEKSDVPDIDKKKSVVPCCCFVFCISLIISICCRMTKYFRLEDIVSILIVICVLCVEGCLDCK